MPRITPPTEFFNDEISTDEMGPVTQTQYEYIKQRLSMPPWMCPKCNLKNHHYNKHCANFRCGVPKP